MPWLVAAGHPYFADMDPDFFQYRDASGARGNPTHGRATRRNSMRLLNFTRRERKCRSFGGTAYSIWYFQQYHPPGETFAGLSRPFDGC